MLVILWIITFTATKPAAALRPCSSAAIHIFQFGNTLNRTTIAHIVSYLTSLISSTGTMACGSACCATPNTVPAVIHTSTLPLLNVDVVGSAIAYEDECCQSKPNARLKDCRTGSAKYVPKKDGCRSSKPVDIKPQDLKRPSCCEGKLSPCCDSSCIDRLALRECASESESRSFRALQSATDPYVL